MITPSTRAICQRRLRDSPARGFCSGVHVRHLKACAVPSPYQCPLRVFYGASFEALQVHMRSHLGPCPEPRAPWLRSRGGHGQAPGLDVRGRRQRQPRRTRSEGEEGGGSGAEGGRRQRRRCSSAA
eukprot:9248253-Pyramimonas_sp.AAC.1